MTEVITVAQPNNLLASVGSDSLFIQRAMKSGSQILHQNIEFQSASNNEFVSIFYPPSTDTLIDRRVLLQATVEVSATALPVGAPRFLPLASCMDTCSVSINGFQTTSRPADMVRVLGRMNNNSHFRARFWSMSPSVPDPVSQYTKCPAQIGRQSVSAALGATVVTNSFTTLDLPWSPFTTEEFFRSEYETSRAAFEKKTNGTAYTYVFTEPLIHPLFTDNEEEALVNVQSLEIACRFKSNLKMLWSNDVAIAGLAVNLVKAKPRLLITYVRAGSPMDIPPKITVPYSEFLVRTHGSNALTTTADNAVTASIQNLIYAQVPSKLFIFVRPKLDGMTEIEADGFACIKNIRITVGNDSGKLASATSQQLYQISVRNGLECTWDQWSRRLGSLLIIDCSADLGLTVGAIGNVTIQYDIDVVNRAYSDFGANTGNCNYNSWEFVTIAQLDGKFSVVPNSAEKILGLNSAELIQALSGQGEQELVARGYLGQGMVGQGRLGSGLVGQGFGSNMTKGGFLGALIPGLAMGALSIGRRLFNSAKPAAAAAVSAVGNQLAQEGQRGAQSIISRYQPQQQIPNYQYPQQMYYQ